MGEHYGKNNLYAATGTGTAAIKASGGGQVRSLHATNRNAAVRYLQFFNQASGAPSGTTNWLFQITVPLSASVTIGEQLFRDQGFPFTTGITYGWSTAATTYTAATAGEHDLVAIYS